VYQNSYSVLAQEEITVPAGTFNTFKTKHEQSHNATGTKRWGVRYFWYAPELGILREAPLGTKRKRGSILLAEAARF
jgi:DUF3108-like